MGTMTLTSLENEVRANLGNRTDLDSRLVNFINFAQDMMCRQHDFQELQTRTDDTTTADTATYTLSSRPRSIYSVRIQDGTNSRKLSYVDIREWDRLIPKPDEYSSSRPVHYTMWQNKIEFWRVPDDSYDLIIRWSKWPTALSGSSDTSDYEHKDDIIVCLATSWAFKSLGERDKMRFWGDHAWRQLAAGIQLDMHDPDRDIVPTSEMQSIMTDYWKDPFIKAVR